VRRHSRNRAQFGHGASEGLIAAETGKNAVVGGSIIPLLTLGVPGSPAAAILLGGLIIHGLFPGPELFTTHARTTYSFMVAMVFVSFAIVVVGVAGSRVWGQVTKLPVQYLTPTVIALCVIGSQATRNNPMDVLAMAGVGLGMFLASKAGFEPAPVVIGLVLGDLAENGFLLGRMLGDAEGSLWAYFFLRPIPMIMIALTVASLVFTAITQGREKAGSGKEEKGGMQHVQPGDGRRAIRRYHLNMAVGVLAILFGFWAESQLAGLEKESVVFPVVLLWIVRAVGAVMIAQELVWGRRHNRSSAFGRFPTKLIPLIAVTLGYVPAVMTVDYYIATGAYLLVVALILETWSPRRFLTRILPVAVGMPVLLYWIFYRLLDVRMHSVLF